MIAKVQSQQVIDTMILLAESLRACPECADKGEQLLRLTNELSACFVDRTSVHDAIEVQTIDDLSDTQVEITTESVLSTLRRAG